MTASERAFHAGMASQYRREQATTHAVVDVCSGGGEPYVQTMRVGTRRECDSFLRGRRHNPNMHTAYAAVIRNTDRARRGYGRRNGCEV